MDVFSQIDDVPRNTIVGLWDKKTSLLGHTRF